VFQAVKKLANSLCKESLGESQLLHIYWPKDQCHLLRDGFVFVDCPGTGMSSNLDKWINRYCQDADVFMYVANAVSTLMDVVSELLFQFVSYINIKLKVFMCCFQETLCLCA
jgi:mitofusin